MRKSFLNNIIKKLFSLLPSVILVTLSVPLIGISYIEGFKLLGLRTVPVPVVGTGSMYPSLFWAKSEGGPEDDSKVVIEEYRSTPHLYSYYKGFVFLGQKFFEKSISYGDMVAFKNDKTKEILKSENKDQSAGFIKRVIGLPGDKIELRDGFVYLNEKLLAEPYISLPRSTYGGVFLKDCMVITIPPDKYFVLGDNRKVSSDSRFELGLIDKGDITYFLPLDEQRIYHSLWRDTSQDDKQLGQPTLSSSDFVKQVNAVRTSKNLPTLQSNSALNKSSYKRGEKLLENNATNYEMKTAIAETGYSNIVLGEFISYGHFSAKELVESLLFNTSTTQQILSQDYSDIGVSAVNKEVDGCPSQVIIGHLGGYIPADYDISVINSWRELDLNLSAVIPTWEAAVGHDQVDQEKLGALLTLLYRRQVLAKEIVNTMEQKEWLNNTQESRIESDEADAKQAQNYIDELNRR